MSSQNTEENTAKYYDIIYKDWINEALTKEELGLVKSLVKPGGKILDIGCGTGRHLIPLFTDGYRIVGIEPVRNMIVELRKKSRNVKVINSEFLSVGLEGRFDLVMMFWNTFNQLAYSEKEAIRVLKKIMSILMDGGVILMGNSNSKDPSDGLNFECEIVDSGKKYQLTWVIQSYDSLTRTTVCTENIRVTDSDGILLDDVNAEIKQRWWSREEITALAKKLGLSVRVKELENSSDLCYVMRVM